MMSYGYNTLRKFPRREYVLKERILSKMFDLIEICQSVKYAPVSSRKYLLVIDMDKTLAVIKRLIRFAHDKDNYNHIAPPLSHKSYDVLSSMLTEIGKMINGLIDNLTNELRDKGIIKVKENIQKNPLVNPNMSNPNPYINMNNTLQVIKSETDSIEMKNLAVFNEELCQLQEFIDDE